MFALNYNNTTINIEQLYIGFEENKLTNHVVFLTALVTMILFLFFAVQNTQWTRKPSRLGTQNNNNNDTLP